VAPEIKPASSPPPVRQEVTEGPFDFDQPDNLEIEPAEYPRRKPALVWPWIVGALVFSLVLLAVVVGFALVSSKQPPRQKESARNAETTSTRGVFAQTQQPEYDPASGIAGLMCCGFWCLLPVLWMAINTAILFWVARDAKSRGMDGAMWIFLILFTGVLGLAIYLFSRPQGVLIQCYNCGNNRMEASMKCPHCGAARGSRSYRDYDE
jgi:hypothetical protein